MYSYKGEGLLVVLVLNRFTVQYVLHFGPELHLFFRSAFFILHKMLGIWNASQFFVQALIFEVSAI